MTASESDRPFEEHEGDVVASGDPEPEGSDMVALASSPAACEDDDARRVEFELYNVLERWSEEHIKLLVDRGEELPTDETLKAVDLALHGIDEFLVAPIRDGIKSAIDAACGEGIGRIPMEDRRVDYQDIGRLILWTDNLRKAVSYLLDTIGEIVLLAHEDLYTLAEGFVPEGTTLEQESWRERLERMHGVKEVL